MRRGFMGMMLKPRCNRHSGWGKGLLDQEKHGWVGQRSRCCWLCFFYWKGIVHDEFAPRGQMVNKQLYQEVLQRFREAMCRKRPELCENQTWMLHHDNASLFIRSYLAKHQTSVVPHPPYSPDLAPADFFLFPKLKTTLKWHRFQTIEEIKGNAIRELRAITESAFQEAFQQWKKRWERCTASTRDYFEGDSA